MMLGRAISHYRILAKLGEGGMGAVYLAEDTALQRKVALKFLPDSFPPDSEHRERFTNEARAAAALNHRNIATIYSIEEEERQMFISMEYIEGRELGHIAATECADSESTTCGLLPVKDAIACGIQIAEGLAAAHAKGVVHRDIKSSNILVTGDGVVKITDFGLATMHGGGRTGSSVTLQGSPAYMSPEQIKGESTDHRTDLWSFGVVLYELLTRNLPFRGEFDAAVMYSIVNEQPEPVRRYRSDVPDAVQEIVQRSLQKNPGDRYQSAAAILADLMRLAAATGSGASGSSPGRSAEREPGNLPVQLTSFVGRERETAEIRNLLHDVRLVTLTGAGGSGKTRLALRVAEDVHGDFAHGAVFVDLAPISNPGVVASAICRTLGLGEVGGQPPVESLRRHLVDKEILLVLDNFEQVVTAGVVLTQLLASCPGLKIVVTSREPLHVSGEQEFPVPPLALPDRNAQHSLEDLARSEAIVLFLHRAKAVRPEFALDEDIGPSVAEICLHLDGLPLGIELAAARIKSISPRIMLQKLARSLSLLTDGPRDVPARQQTLRGTIDWSYALLNDDERKLLRRLAVFAGGCALEAAEAVCTGPNDLKIDVLEGLASLVDKSLLRQGDQSRFVMLETIREFGLECLAATGEAMTITRAHREFFLTLAEEAARELTGVRQKEWLDKLDREHDNLRAAFDSSVNAEDIHAELRLCAALARFWLIRGHLEEGREKLAHLVAHVPASMCSEPLAQVLTMAGQLAQNQADYTSARTLFDRGLAIYRNLGLTHGVAGSLNNLGWLAFRVGDYAAARARSEESLALHRELKEDRGIATSLTNLGTVAHCQGDFTAARSFHQESLSLRRRMGDRRDIAFSLANLGWAIGKQGEYDQAADFLHEATTLFRELGDRQLRAFAFIMLAGVEHDRGNFDQAEALLERESLPIDREIGSKYGIAFSQLILGDVMLRRGDHSRASVLYAESLALREEAGDKWGVAQSKHRLGEVARCRGEYDSASLLFRDSLRLRSEMGDRLGIIECLEGLAGVACQLDNADRALLLLGASMSLRMSIGSPVPLCLQSDQERLLVALRERLGPRQVSDALSGVNSPGMEEAVEVALR